MPEPLICCMSCEESPNDWLFMPNKCPVVLPAALPCLTDLTRAHARTRYAGALQVEVVNLEYSALQRRRKHNVAGGTAAKGVAIDFTNELEYLSDSHVLQLQ